MSFVNKRTFTKVLCAKSQKGGTKLGEVEHPMKVTCYSVYRIARNPGEGFILALQLICGRMPNLKVVNIIIITESVSAKHSLSHHVFNIQNGGRAMIAGQNCL